MARPSSRFAIALVLGCAATLVMAACQRTPQTPEDVLRSLAADAGVEPLSFTDPDQAMLDLGAALFFDPLLSGNRDVSCATCHEPALATTDDLSLSIGTGGLGRGERRVLSEAFFHVPRNAPDLYNRGADGWHAFFWDGRVAIIDGELVTPAGEAMPDEVTSVQVAQALITLASPIEMRGFPGDSDVNGDVNELARFAPDEWTAIWEATFARVVAIEEYRELLGAAYPNVSIGDMTLVHAVDALIAYQGSAFRADSTAFDRFLAGDDAAMDALALSGAELFFGSGGCAECHSGPLLTDQAFYSLAVPQVGPGRGEVAPLDAGSGALDGSDVIAFRTPPLRNVEHTAPYFHDGAFWDLSDAVRHHLDPLGSLAAYDPTQLRDDVRVDHLDSIRDDVAGSLSSGIPVPQLTEADIEAIVAFLIALTDPDTIDLEHLIPETVPSGLELYPEPKDRPARES